MTKPSASILVLSLALLLSAAAVPALPQTATAPQTEKQKVEAPRYSVTRAASKIKIDGNVDEEAWASAVVIPLQFEWSPGDNIPAPVNTECLMTYDTHNLYLDSAVMTPNRVKSGPTSWTGTTPTG